MKRSSPMGIGIITIITVLLVLILTVFAALTLSSARADQTLSQINADTVTAYYAADARAARLYADFCAGTEPELETTLPISEGQALYLHFSRTADGLAQILAWQTRYDEETQPEPPLQVWTENP